MSAPSNLLSAQGASAPKVFLIADYAQKADLETGALISGYQGEFLKKLAREAGLDYQAFYRTAILKQVPPKLKWEKKKKPSEIESAAWLISEVVEKEGHDKIFQNELEELKPNLLVPLGELGFQFLTGLSDIRKFRGSVLPSNRAIGTRRTPLKVLPILGPYPYINQEPRLQFLSQIDFNRIAENSSSAPIPADVYNIWIARSSDAFRNFLNRQYQPCLDRKISDGGFVVFDIETYMNIPTCIGFCFDGYESVCVPLVDFKMDLGQRALMLGLVRQLLDSPIPKVNQNIKFDWKCLERWGFRVRNVVGDTMLAANCIYPEFPKNLGFLTSIYTNLPYFKDEGKEFDPAKVKADQLYLYNAKDCLATHQVYVKQLVELKEQKTEEVYNKLVQLVPIYKRLEDRGIRVDEATQQRLVVKYELLLDMQMMKLERLTNQKINPRSPIQCSRLIFDELGYNEKQQGVDGTGEESLNMLMCFGAPTKCTVERGKEILNILIACRKIQKVLELANLLTYPDGRFRCEYNLAGTKNGRTSSSQTSDYFLLPDPKRPEKTKKINLGLGLQLIGKHGFKIDGVQYGDDIRDMFVSSPGYKFVEIDLSGAEARVDRVLSGNFDLSVFDNPGIHKLTGSWLFDCQPQDVKKGSHEYHLAKTFRHAGERNMQDRRAFSLVQSESLGISMDLKTASLLLAKFHANAPEIQGVFHRDVETFVKVNHFLECPNGRRRDFFDRFDHSLLNEAISYLPQAIVSDPTKFSFIPTFRECREAWLLAEAHDGSLAEVPEDKVLSYARCYKKNIESPIDFRKGSLKRDYQLVIPCESSVGETWGQMEEMKEMES
jgi:DNA polymerase I-like protein with 3'-5' exonuclease and polymerase domains/uracil-DNA glycosylase